MILSAALLAVGRIVCQTIKFMKRKIFMACAALVVSAAAVVGVKAYNYYSMPALMRSQPIVKG